MLLASDYSPPLGDLQSFENEWVEVEMRAPKGWCEPANPSSLSTISNPIAIPSSETIDESNVPPFLRDDLESLDALDERDLRGFNLLPINNPIVKLPKLYLIFFFYSSTVQAYSS